MKLFVTFLVLSILTGTGCDMKTDSPKRNISLSHPNGLRATINLSYQSIREHDSGYIIGLSLPDSRQVSDIKIVHKNTYEVIDLKSRVIDEQQYLYREETVDGGPGGPEYTLTIWKPLSGDGVLLTYYDQTDSKLELADVWGIIESATVENK